MKEDTMPTGQPLPLCCWCKHFDTKYQKETSEFRCTAFPEGIPDEIAGDKSLGIFWFDHRLPYPDDHGIQFERGDVEDLKHRSPFQGGDENVIERRLNRVYDYLDRENAYRAENPDE
jgi:hypothetical protein